MKQRCPVGGRSAKEKAQQPSDVNGVNAASQVFIAAISARDISAMDEVWAQEPYVTFIGPLSTTVVAGWEGVRKAWEMRFGQFDRVIISLADSSLINGKVSGRSAPRRIVLIGRQRFGVSMRWLTDISSRDRSS